MFSIINPANEEVVTTVAPSSLEEVDEAIARSTEALASWRDVAPGDRANMLRRFSEHPQLAPLLPLLHATLAYADRLAVGAERRQLFDARMGRSDTAEGLQQGAPPSSGRWRNQ